MTDERLDELARQEPTYDHTMSSGCSDYACYCHAKVPELVAEIRRLRLVLGRVERWDVPGPDAEGHSFGLQYGSNGERDFIRGLVAEALGRQPNWFYARRFARLQSSTSADEPVTAEARP